MHEEGTCNSPTHRWRLRAKNLRPINNFCHSGNLAQAEIPFWLVYLIETCFPIENEYPFGTLLGAVAWSTAKCVRAWSLERLLGNSDKYITILNSNGVGRQIGGGR